MNKTENITGRTYHGTEEQFQDLLKEWSYADIEIATIELHKQMRKQYEDAIEEEVKAIAKQREESRRLLVADDHFQIFSTIMQKNMPIIFLRQKCIYFH